MGKLTSYTCAPNSTGYSSTITNTVCNSSNIVTSSSKVLKVNGEVIKLSAESFDEDSLKRKITQILLEDPDSDIKKMAEDYLIQCLYEATEDPENNPILHKFFGRDKEETERLANDIWEVRNEILSLKTELQNLKDKLRLDNDFYNEGVAWKNDLNSQFGFLENKLIRLTEKLEKKGINISYWEN